MPTVALATTAPALPPTTAQIQADYDSVPAFLDRKLNGITTTPAKAAPAKIPYAGKEKPAETRELKAAVKALPGSATNPQITPQKVTPKVLPAGGGSAAALRKALKASTAPKVAKKVATPKAVKSKAAPKANGASKAAKATKAPKASAVAKELRSRGMSKLDAIAALLTRKCGTTNAEILEATGWPSVSVPQQATAAGLKLRKEKEKGKPTRYFGSK